MNQKQAKLDQIKAIWDLYDASQKETDSLREHLVDKVREAKALNATQQQIADQTGLSRQRIQQMLVN